MRAAAAILSVYRNECTSTRLHHSCCLKPRSPTMSSIFCTAMVMTFGRSHSSSERNCFADFSLCAPRFGTATTWRSREKSSSSWPENRDWKESSASLRTAYTSDRKSTRLNSSHGSISYAVFCLKKKKKKHRRDDNKKCKERSN